jgi:NAD(P)-dependent dehydrogenase (short-subunit alcohol dehydrogenase family)
MDLQLTGKRVLVTGGTRGIGRAIVGAFLDEGAVVGFCARDSADVETTNDDLSSRGAVTGSVVDVGDGDALAAWVERSAEAFGGLDIVVANVSALAIPDTEENWQASFNVDLMHTVRLVRAALPYLEHSDAASIIAISSVSGASPISPRVPTALRRPRSSAISTVSRSIWRRRTFAQTPSRPGTRTSMAGSGTASRPATRPSSRQQ